MMRTAIIFLTLFQSFCYSQTTARLSYYFNNKNVSLKELEVIVVREKDTINIETVKNKLKFPKIESNFNLLIKVNNEVFEFGPIASEVLNEDFQIVVGKITSIKKLKQSPFEPSAYYLRDKYLIHIEKPEIIDELNFITLIQTERLGENKFKEHQIGRSKIIKQKTNGI